MKYGRGRQERRGCGIAGRQLLKRDIDGLEITRGYQLKQMIVSVKRDESTGAPPAGS